MPKFAAVGSKPHAAQFALDPSEGGIVADTLWHLTENKLSTQGTDGPVRSSAGPTIHRNRRLFAHPGTVNEQKGTRYIAQSQ